MYRRSPTRNQLDFPSYPCLESGDDSPCISVENTMTININGEGTVVNVDAATVDGVDVSYSDGKFAFDILM